MKDVSRVLIIDDVPESVRLIEIFLRAEGYAPETTDSPLKALEALANEPADLVIADHNMPGMTGMEMLERVSMLWPRTALLLLTADLSVREDASCPYPVMYKPFRLGELRSMVELLLRTRRRTG